MKITLTSAQYTFTPASNQIIFLFGGSFKPENLYAVINTTTGKLVYAAASVTAGYGGTFSTTTFTNDTLIYNSSNAGQSPTDLLQCIYDDAGAIQNVNASGQISANTYSGYGETIPGIYDNAIGEYRLAVDALTKTSAADGTPIYATYDPQSGEDGLNVNLLNSSFGGQVGSAMPIPNNNNALSMGFLNGSVLVAPAMDPVTNELKVQGTFTAPALQNVNLTEVNGSAVSLGQKVMNNSIPVVIADDQTAIPVTIEAPPAVATDVLGADIIGQRSNQLEISFNAAPGATLITNTFTGAGSVSITNGHSIYQTGAVGAAASAQAVTVQTTTYRPAHEVYAAFTAAFTNMILTRSDAKIGLFDANNGFFVGYNITQGFSVGVRVSGSDTIVNQLSFNTDLLDGNPNSKFTRDNLPEALDWSKSNLFRIRFAWLGSANIYYEVFSPDGEWVLFHNIKQPNSAYNPSIANPNLPMSLTVSKISGTQNSQVATACWAAGTTSDVAPITQTLTDNSLAKLTRSVITGVTTGGGGGYVNVKVNPSGALTTETTISGVPTVDITRYGGVGTTLGQKVTASSIPVVLPSDMGSLSTNLNQVGGSSITLGQKTAANSLPVVISSDQSSVNTLQPEVYVTGAATNLLGNNLILASVGSGSYDAAGYKSGSCQVVTAATTGNFTFEGSNDNINFQVIPVFRNDSASPNAILTAITATASQFIYIFPIKFRYIRLRISSALNNSCQVFTRFSQDAWTPTVTNVVNATAANLNANISGTATVSGTVTVTQATPANLNVTAAVTGATLSSSQTTDIASAAITTTQTSANISQLNLQACSFGVYVTAITGTSPTMDVSIEETLDGTNYYTIYQFERITATGQFYSPTIKLSGSGLRYVRTVGGTTPSITNSVIRVSRQGQAETMRRFINRTIVPNTLNSTTGSFFCDGVEDFNLVVRCTAQTTAATIALEFSTDNTNWFTSACTVTTVNGIAQNKIDNMQFKFVRATVTAAGTGITLDNVYIGGHSA